MRRAIAGHDQRVLLLGVTPEYADVGADVTAIDSSETMIANVWPGDTARRRAFKGDWFAMPFERGSFSAALGDGSFNTLPWPDGHRRVFDLLADMLRPGGRIVFRLFRTPDEAESVDAVLAAAMAKKIGNFHAFKWRLAMALVAAAGNPNIPVASIRDAFNAAFPDREKLAAATGWPMAQIETIDVYRGSPDSYSFPTSAEMQAAIPAAFTRAEFLPSGDYELAERCPLVRADLKS